MRYRAAVVSFRAPEGAGDKVASASKIPPGVPDAIQELSTPSTRQQVLSRTEARSRLRVSKPVFEALRISGLLGPHAPDGRVSVAGIEHFERYGTQWHHDLDERLVPEETHQNMPLPPDVNERQPPGVRSQAQILPQDAHGNPDQDTGWLAQFYLRPNRLFFPDPTELALVGPLPLKLATPKEIRGANPSARLYPDPSGSLAMVAVMGFNEPAEDPFDAAYDVAGPILDELSFGYDQPLPVAQSLVVGVPSGAINVYYPQHPALQEIAPGDVVLPACPYPELRDAVALYREGVSSNNPFHAFLTLWKAYENVVRDVRPAWSRELRRSDTKARAETIPEVWAFRGLSGLSFDQVKQQLNRPYRVALAHGSDIRDGKPITAASAADFNAVSTKVPLVRYMARVVIENMRTTLASSDKDSPET
jgi:hypothetical protein